MAQSDSSSRAWERLNDAVYAVEALGQIISQTNAPSYEWWEHVSSVFCHLASSLGEARNGYEDVLAANCQSSPVSLVEVPRG